MWGGLLIPAPGRSQDGPPPLNFEPQQDAPFSILRAASRALLPELVKGEMELKRYVRDPRFSAVRRFYGDLIAVDAVYLKALEIVDYDVREALLISIAATMDHRRLNLRLPLGGMLSLPLTGESDSLFHIRWTNLPAFFRAGKEEPSDRDKLQHFFGSSYLTYTIRSAGLASLAGLLVEWGEERFVVGGRNDWRDLLANAQGRAFGTALGEDPTILPSAFLQETFGGQHFSGTWTHEVDSCRGR